MNYEEEEEGEEDEGGTIRWYDLLQLHFDIITVRHRYKISSDSTDLIWDYYSKNTNEKTIIITLVIIIQILYTLATITKYVDKAEATVIKTNVAFIMM